MATLYISEFKQLATIGTTVAQICPQPSLVDQTLAIGASSVASNAFNALTGLVLLSSDAVCSIVFGATPVAAATNFRLPANTVIPFAVGPGQKVAVITNT